MHLPHTLQLSKFRKHQPERVLHPLVRVLPKPFASGLHITGSDAKEERTPAGFLLQRFLRALTEQR